MDEQKTFTGFYRAKRAYENLMTALFDEPEHAAGDYQIPDTTVQKLIDIDFAPVIEDYNRSH